MVKLFFFFFFKNSRSSFRWARNA